MDPCPQGTHLLVLLTILTNPLFLHSTAGGPEVWKRFLYAVAPPVCGL